MRTTRGEYRHDGKYELTKRQLEVLGMLAAGYTDPQIGCLINVSENTAKRHVRDILSKLSARNRANAVHLAHQRGLLK